MLFDKDGDGTITVDELGTVMSSMGHMPSEDDLRQMIAEVDKDDSGSIDFFEFCHLMGRNMSKQDDPELLMEAFKMFDKDGGGTIDFKELKEALSEIMGGTDDLLPEEEIEEILREADADGPRVPVPARTL